MYFLPSSFRFNFHFWMRISSSVSSSFSFFKENVNRNWEWEKTSFSPLFSFFLFLFFRFSDFFFLLFVPLSCFGGEMGVGGSRNFSSSFSKFLSFLGEKWEEQLEKFEGNSSSFSFLFSLFFLSFQPSDFQFLGKEMEIWEDKNECPKHAKKILQEHSSF